MDKRTQLAGDLWGGFAAMLVALPAAIAFGVTIFAPLGAEYAGKGALAGMLGVTALGLIAAGFGGTQRLISAPCAPAAAVLSALALQFVQQGQEPPTIILLLFLIAFVTGLMQICFGALRVGTLIKFMPFQVVSGYLTGVGLIMIFGQLTKLLATPKGMPWWEAIVLPDQWQLHSVAVGVATAASMTLAPKLTTKIPAVIIGLLGGVIVYWVLALSLVPELAILDGNRFVIGRLSADVGGLIDAAASPWTSILYSPLPKSEHILLPALTLAVLLSIDTLKTCVVLDALTGSRHRSNKELIGQGLGNLAATVIGGVPGAGTMGATMVNRASGGNTFRSGIFQGIFALVAVLLLTPAIAWIPIASLSALLMVVGWRMIDWHAVQLLRHRDTVMDFAIIATVFMIASTFSLIAASAVGVILAVLLFLTEQIHSSPVRRKSTLAKISSKRIRSTEERTLLAKEGESCVVVELQGTVFFGTTDQLFQSIEADVNKA
ncbi:MAG: SulP family inorganic anion transporter, partial [Burkholderiaceae bacterium]